MHSSKLRGTDFEIAWRGEVISHARFFSSFQDTDRVGVVIPRRVEGVGAITLIMAYVTAFYDRYRERVSEFFAYPDFFTFQHEAPCADYGMCDIWPRHKNVHVAGGAQLTVEAVTDRGVNVLLVPDSDPSEVSIEEVELESARRNIGRCFVYSESGSTEAADLAVECRSELLSDYALAVLKSVDTDGAAQEQQERWMRQAATETLRQSFRELELSDALRRI